jgi:predicted DNA-binding transcriptional regulator AlpA
MDADASISAGSTGSGGDSPKAHQPLGESREPLAPDRAMESAPRGAAAPLGEPLVDAETVARFLAVDTATVYRLARTAALPSIQVAPRVLRFRPDEIRGYIDRRTRKAAPSGRVKRLLGSTS